MFDFIRRLFYFGFFKKVVKTYRNYLGENLVSIVLFGSRARGEAKPESDYDLFIVAKKLPENLFERIRFVRKPIVGQFKERIAIIVKTPEEMEANFPSLYLDLGLDGIILYDTNYFNRKKKNILKLIKEGGLQRMKTGNTFRWRWLHPPKGLWAIGWGGVNAQY